MRRALLSAVVAAACWGCDSTQPSVATSISISPSSVSFDALGVLDTLEAVVLDQRGDVMLHVPVTWSVEGSAVTVAALGTDSAVVSSTGEGTALIRAAAEGGAGGEVAATVTRAPAYIELLEGDQQRAIVGNALPAPIRVAVKDRMGSGIAGIVVSFEVLLGGGAVTATTVESAADGTASVGWTLGTTAGTNQLKVSSPVMQAHLSVTASGRPGPPHSISVLRGDGQSAPTGADVPIAPAVFVQDQHGNAVGGAGVSYQITAGGGRIFSGDIATRIDGTATAGGWRLGPTAGQNTLRVQVPEHGLSVNFNATAISRLRIEIDEGGGQAGRAGAALPVPLSIIVLNQENEPIGGVPISFQVLEGGGSIANVSAVTNGDGIASAGAWTLGPDAALNRIIVRGTAPTLEDQYLNINGYGCSPGTDAGFGISFCYLTSMPASRRQIFEGAAARWAGVIAGDLPDVNVNLAAPCGDPAEVRMVVDDLLIFVSLISIDGWGGVLAQAGPCRIRGSNGLPYIGVMQVDQADLALMEELNVLESVLLHEMAHVVGVGTLWGLKGLLALPSEDGVQNDTYFSGANAIEAFDAVGGTTYAGGRKVPVENTGGDGTRNSHWRETVFQNELMTGFIDAGQNPLSLVTVRSLEDLGYVVDRTRAEPYTYFPALRRSGAAAPNIPLGDDVLDIPLWRVDATGREVRIR